jgi:RecA-family ATPase
MMHATEAFPRDAKVESEQALLGLQLREGVTAIAIAREEVGSLADFFDAPHDRIQHAIFDLEKEDASIAPATVAIRLANDPGLQELGGRDYLVNVAAAAPAVLNDADVGRRMRATIAEWKTVAKDSAVRSSLDRRLGSADLVRAAELASRFEPYREFSEVCASSLAGRQVPSRQDYVEGLIPRNAVTIMGGDGGTGKSLLALQLAAAARLKVNWIGRVIFEEGPVLFLSAEDTIDELHRRLSAIAAEEQATLDQLRGLHLVSFVGEDAFLAVSNSHSAIEPTPLFSRLERRIAALKPALIVLDTLADFFGGDENNRAQARQFIAMLRGLAIRHDSTALLLAHPSQSGLASGSGTSGSTGWSNSARSRLYFERVKSSGDVEDDPDARILRCKKFNYGPAGGEIRLRWQRGVFTHRLDSAAVASVHAKADRVFLEMLGAYTAEGRLVRATTGHGYAPSVFAADKQRNEGVTARAFADAMNRLFELRRVRLEESGPPSKRRTHLVLVTVDGLQ